MAEIAWLARSMMRIPPACSSPNRPNASFLRSGDQPGSPSPRASESNSWGVPPGERPHLFNGIGAAKICFHIT
jgi:hypothetical protein